MAQQQDGRRPPDPDQSREYRRVSRGSAGASGQSARKRAKARRQQELRRQRHLRTLLGVALLAIIAVAFFLIKTLNGSLGAAPDDGLDVADLENESDDDLETDYDGPPIATIAFVGDISTSADQIRAVTKADGNYDFSIPFTEVADYFSQDSVAYAVGSLETTMVDGLSYGGEPYYNSPVELAGSLWTLGFRLMSTATTCALNNGIEGVTSTKNYLIEARLRAVGTYRSREEREENGGAYIRTIHKIKFAFLSYTKGTDSVTMPEGCEYALSTLYSDYSDYWSDLDSAQIRKDVQAAKDAGAEVIVALVHWGSEYGRSVSELQREAADVLLSSGVDVIVGSHSHLVNEMGFREVTMSDGTVKQCFVAYGLGDFYTDPQQDSARQSVILNLEFAKDSDGKVTITEASYVPIYMYISEVSGVRQFRILDAYKSLAELYRTEELTADQAELYNQLLETVDTLHTYAGEDLDRGPADEDRRYVEQAIEEGEVPSGTIKALREQEAEAAMAEAEAEEMESAKSGDSEDGEDDEEE